MKRYPRTPSLVMIQVCTLLTPCVVLGQVTVGRTPTVNTSPAVDAVSQTIADALSTANLTAAAAAISGSAKGIAHTYNCLPIFLGNVPLCCDLNVVVQAMQTFWRKS